MKLPVLYMCTGSSCKRARDERRSIRKKVDGLARVVKVPCQELCSAPVVGCEVEGRLEWFRRVDSPKSRRSLVALLGGGPMAPSLAKRRAKKRSGRSPK